MIKRFLQILIVMYFTGLCAFAASNYLNAVVLEGTDNSYNIVLRSDQRTKIKKTVQASDRITLTLKGITAADNISTLYKDTAQVNSLVVENSGNGELKIYVQAPGIDKANVVFENPDSTPIAVDVNSLFAKLLCITMLGGMIFIGVKSTRTLNSHTYEPYYKRNIKDRELELYRNFKREVATMNRNRMSTPRRCHTIREQLTQLN